MKYIIVEAPEGEKPILFPRSFAHRYVAEVFAPMPVVAAGFVDRQGGLIVCGGSSVGLRIASRPERDTQLVRAALGG